MKKTLLAIAGLLSITGSANAWTPVYNNNAHIHTKVINKQPAKKIENRRVVKRQTNHHNYRNAYRQPTPIVVHPKPNVVVIEKTQPHHHSNILSAFFLGFLLGQNG